MQHEQINIGFMNIQSVNKKENIIEALILDNHFDGVDLEDDSEELYCDECFTEQAVWKCDLCGKGVQPAYYCDHHRDSKLLVAKFLTDFRPA